MLQSYNINIYERYNELKKSKAIINNNNLNKIFEFYTCIKLIEEYKREFFEYNDITPEFKKNNKLTKYDSGIDCSDLLDTIVQCKLRKNNLTWKECSTFFGSQVIIKDNIKIIRWNNLIIATNKECKFSENLIFKNDLFIDKKYNTDEIIKYCDNLLLNPPEYPKEEIIKFQLRDYQIECINLIKNNNNTIICIPTGTGKNVIIANSLLENNKYLILVPRIILLEQIQEEIIKHNPTYKNKIQLIGDNHKIKNNKNIVICVYNSINLITDFTIYTKIFVDEAHHIYKPEIYKNDDDEIINDVEINENDKIIENNKIIENDKIIKDNENIEKTYIYQIQQLQKLNNNVYLSATINEINGFKYYKKEINEMIEKQYLTDYDIQIPVFNKDITNKNICEHLINNYRNIIVYCNSCDEGIKINTIFNKIQNNSSKYIDCMTPKNERNEILKEYKEGKIPFLVNVKILVEGFDAPITKGVCFLHMPSSNTVAIQIIGRALRLHKLKKIAHIILPFTIEDNETQINNFIRILMKNDNRISKYTVNISKNDDNEITNDNIDDSIFECINNKIYSSMDIPLDKNKLWIMHFNEVVKFIDENKYKPSYNDENINIKKLGKWIFDQNYYYNKKLHLMKNDEIYKLWTDFIETNKQYFMSNEEIWNRNFILVQEYINKYNKRPTNNDDDDEQTKYLSIWISEQRKKYKNHNKIMQNDLYWNKWNDFINLNKNLFLTIEEKWYKKYDLVKEFIKINNNKPSISSDEINEKILANWIIDQKQNYKNKERLMNNEIFYNEWTKFIELNEKLFLTCEERWNVNFNLLQKYIDENKKLPSSNNSDVKISNLGNWFLKQNNDYKKETMKKNKNRYDKWKKLIEQNKNLFLTKDEIWEINLNLVQEFINENGKKPTLTTNKKLCYWISDRFDEYNKNVMIKNKFRYDKWTNFLLLNEKLFK